MVCAGSGTVWENLTRGIPVLNAMSHATPVGQWSIYLWSHTTPIGQSSIVPIPIRLAIGVFICGPIQHQLANQALSPSTSGWPMWYLFVVPYNTGWPTKHCLHPNPVGQWGTYLWSHATANWLGVTWDDKISIGQLVSYGTTNEYPIGQPDVDGDNA